MPDNHLEKTNMLTENDIERIMHSKKKFIESFIDADDYDLDDDEELMQLIAIETDDEYAETDEH